MEKEQRPQENLENEKIKEEQIIPEENKNPEEFFDATIDETPVELSPETETAIAEAKRRADHQAKVLEILSTDFNEQKRRSFRRVVAMSIGSVAFLLILAIIFFIFLHWYIAGTGVAIIALGVSQVWLHFFKKWNYNSQNDLFAPDAEDRDLNSTDSTPNIDNDNIDNQPKE